MPAQLVDTYIFKYEKPFLVESSDGSKRLKVRGRFQMADEINDNNRRYPLAIWQKRLSETSPVMKRVASRSMLGTLEHPEDGQTRLGDSSHVITKLELTPSGEVVGEAEVLDTSLGRELRALFEANVTVGISSRGTGTVTEKNGVYEVNDDYQLETFDFVYNNSVANATPKPVMESKEKPMPTTANPEAPKKERRLNEMRQVDLRIGKFNQIDISKLDLGQRAELQNALIEERCNIDGILAEDASLTTYGQRLQKKLDAFETLLAAEPKAATTSTTTEADGKAKPTPEQVIEAYKRLCSALIERCKTQKAVLEEAESKDESDDSPEGYDEEQNAEVIQELVKRYKALEKIMEEVLSRTSAIRAKAALFERRFNVSVELIEALVEKYKEDIGSEPLTESKKGGANSDPLPSDKRGVADTKPVKGAVAESTELGSANSAIALLERARKRRATQPQQ